MDEEASSAAETAGSGLAAGRTAADFGFDAHPIAVSTIEPATIRCPMELRSVTRCLLERRGRLASEKVPRQYESCIEQSASQNRPRDATSMRMLAKALETAGVNWIK